MSLIEEFGLKQSQTPQDTLMICLQPFCWHCPTASPAPWDLLKSDPGGIVPWPPAGPFPCPCESHSCAVHPMAQHVGTALWNQGQFQPLPSQPPLLQTDLIASAAIQQLEGSGKAQLCLCRFRFVSNTGFPPPSSRTQVISALSVLEGFGSETSVLEFPFPGGNSCCVVTQSWKKPPAA